MSEQDKVIDKLHQDKKRLEEKIESIRRDLRQGLDASSDEQSIQLENYEVLMEILKISEDELESVNQKINHLQNPTP